MAKAFPTQAVGSGSAPAKTSTDSNQLTYAGGRIPAVSYTHLTLPTIYSV